MAKKKVTLSINSDIYDEYRQYCEDNGILLSKKIDLFMQSELKTINEFLKQEGCNEDEEQ